MAESSFIGDEFMKIKKRKHCKNESIGIEEVDGLYYVSCYCKVLRCRTVKGFKTENEAILFWNSDK